MIHLLGAAKGFGWVRVDLLTEPIGPGMGAIWLAAAALVLSTGVLLGIGLRWWWVVGGVAVAVSQGVIFTSWSDAKAGTFANLILLAAVPTGTHPGARVATAPNISAWPPARSRRRFPPVS